MRVALLSIIATTADQQDGSGRRGMLPYGGVTLAEMQLSFATALGCEKILCFTDLPAGQLAGLRKSADRANVQIHAIGSVRQLGLHLDAADELLVIADGLLPASDAAISMLEGNAILALPADTGVAAGFERIDLHHAWAGVLIMPGSLVERLHELPEDVDPASALLRIALQAHVPQKFLSGNLIAQNEWGFVRSVGEARARERQSLHRASAMTGKGAPSTWLATAIAGRWGMALADKGIHPPRLVLIAALTALIALACAWFGLAAPGLMMMAVAYLTLELARILGQALPAIHSRPIRATAILALLDIAVAIVLALGAAREGGASTAGFAALTLIGLTNLPTPGWDGRWAQALHDRVLLALVCFAAALAGVLLIFLQAMSLGLITLGLYARFARTRLTQA